MENWCSAKFRRAVFAESGASQTVAVNNEKLVQCKRTVFVESGASQTISVNE